METRRSSMKFGILDRTVNKVISWYVGDRIAYKAPFADLVKYLHFEITEEYPEGYSINELGNLVYDFTYTPPVAIYTIAKDAELTDIQEGFTTLSRAFAVDNSDILNTEIVRMATEGEIDPSDTAAVAAFVRSKLDPLVDALTPLFNDIKMHYFWRISEHMAAVPREDLLASNERLAQYESNLLALVNPS